MDNFQLKSAIAILIKSLFILSFSNGIADPGENTIFFIEVANPVVASSSANRKNIEKIRLYFRNLKITYSNPLRFGNSDLTELGKKCSSVYDSFQIESIRLIGYSSRYYYYHVFCLGYARCDNKYDRFRYIVYIERSSERISIQKKEKINFKELNNG
jgi:hypothetical protein